MGIPNNSNLLSNNWQIKYNPYLSRRNIYYSILLIEQKLILKVAIFEMPPRAQTQRSSRDGADRNALARRRGGRAGRTSYNHKMLIKIFFLSVPFPGKECQNSIKKNLVKNLLVRLRPSNNITEPLHPVLLLLQE